ncbi:putative pyruvate, phosphate dikinase regulatory protein [Cohnella xylanilytica]|uniref:Putative pyruvate, phosphate dikinase regulatory protein n=1 Tax=Cohnella xylanilytica TaxID=557555 RepID=A0A841U406_9BACL|nr:pyruvate, water dikinase regulatory protein [Cohnella xylanilytica]MBB6695457.1 kinase/pyrophosphorylase [Cohnella xylanilytica]GIO13364.1 putative pyruvate, phosphate dikinase regulatory protein [Cohnella xylanilytica]
MSSDSVTVYVVSDSAGDTGELAVRAAAAQFHPLQVQIRRVGFIQSREGIDAVLDMAASDKGILLYTLVIPRLREHMTTQAEARGIVTIDLLGPLIDNMERLFGRPSRHEPGLNHVLDAGYFRKVEAVEFAVRYDDARDVTGILKADIVLTGVSRTSKTPLSMVLAHKTFKVANVPLVPELVPPKELFQVDPKKVIGLTIRTDALNAIRKERLKALGLPDSASYATTARIEQELEYAHGIMKKIGCVVIDVSSKAVEETASLILDHFQNG